MNSSVEHLKWLEYQYVTMKSKLLRWASINSGSYHSAGLSDLCQKLQGDMVDLPGKARVFQGGPIVHMDQHGELQKHPGSPIIIHEYRQPGTPCLALGGHLDTVYPPHSSFQDVSAIDDFRWRGPGVADMKGGLLVLLYGLRAFLRSPYRDKLSWKIIINSDEEVGSLGSMPVIEAQLADVQLGLLFEPALDEKGTLARARKGSGKFLIQAIGTEAHAGREFAKGRNAVVALTKIVQQVHRLNGQRPGVTLNLGLFHGGVAANQVPGKACCQIDVRYRCNEDCSWILDQLQDLVKQANQDPNFEFQLIGTCHRPVKTISQAGQNLYQEMKQCAEQLRLQLPWQDTGGCCDGNNWAHFGIPCLDSLGVRGGNIHSEGEFIILPSLLERAQLLALFLMRLAAGEINLP